MRRFILLLLLILFLFTQGCAVIMAARQPGRKNVQLFRVGTPRSLLLAEFGLPLAVEEREGKEYEIFSFNRGYSTGTKVFRVFFHAAADVFTLFLWEVIGTPAEAVFTGAEIAYEVSYDKDNRIDSLVLLKGE